MLELEPRLVERLANACGSPVLELTPLDSPLSTNALFLARRRDRTSVLKVYSKERAGHIERAALTALAECAPGQVPALLAEARVDGWFALELEQLPCAPWRLRHDEAGHQFVDALATLLARVHRAPLASARWGSLLPEDTGAADWASYLERRVAERGARLRARDQLPDAALQAVARRVAASHTLLRVEAQHPVLLHNDLNPSNILQRPDGAPVLIDFERSLAGHALYEQVKLDWLLSSGCDECARRFAAGAGQPSALLEIYRLVYAIDMSVYLSEHGVTDADRVLLARLLGRVREAAA
jgi:Ser/Thr protein kinase RdoA (MazF antagonist)